MTATKKLFIAALLLTVGFGVARLMGRPDAPWLRSRADEGSAFTGGQTKIAKPVTNAISPIAATNDVRLVPDFSASNPYHVTPDASAVHSSLSQNTNSTGFVAAPQHVLSNGIQSSFSTAVPSAKLRDEAPRPLDFEQTDSSTAYAQPMPSSQLAGAAPVAPARSAAADWRASGLTQAEFVQDTANVPGSNVSYSQPIANSSFASTVAPPPWPAEVAEANGPRTHVVVDGDSLERLAGRYLDDASRGNEIYEANRERLTSPELLPIGAELVIPKRNDRSAFDASTPQSSLASDPSLRAAYHGVARPLPPAANVVPRAQLLPPKTVD